MDNTTLDLVRQAINSKPDEFKDTFNDIMANKVANAVDMKYDEMFASASEEESFEEPEVDDVEVEQEMETEGE